MLRDVVEQRGEDGQQSGGGVVDVLGHAFDLNTDTQTLHQLSMNLSCEQH